VIPTTSPVAVLFFFLSRFFGADVVFVDIAFVAVVTVTIGLVVVVIVAGVDVNVDVVDVIVVVFTSPSSARRP
jgi:hypothetical protein